MRHHQRKAPAKEGKAPSAQELTRRLWAASQRADGAGNIRRLLEQGADPESLCKEPKRFLRHDEDCWLMRVAAFADADLLERAWGAIKGRPVASAPKLLAAVFICAWRGDEKALGDWLSREAKAAGATWEWVGRALVEAAKTRHSKAFLAMMRLAPPGTAHASLGKEGDSLWGLCAHSPTLAAILIEHGADVEARDGLGRTALLRAADEGWGEGVKFLSSVADPRARDHEGRGLEERLEHARGRAREAMEEAISMAQALDLREEVRAAEPSRPRRSL